MSAKFDFHVHTKYSDGVASPIVMIEAANARKLEAVAITDHGPRLSVGIMSDKIGQMIGDFERAKENVSTVVLLGLESNVVNERGAIDLLEQFLRRLDLLIVGIHHVGKALPPKELAREYIHWATRALERNRVDILAHPFFLNHNLLDDLTASEIEDFVKFAAKRGVAMEVNVKYRVPNDEFLRLCLSEGVKLSVGTDAHTPGEVGDIEWALAKLKTIGAKREDLVIDRFL